MNAKIIGFALLSVLAIVGVAQAQGGDKSASSEQVVKTAYERQEERAKSQIGGNFASISARPGRRGPRGPRGARGPVGATGATGPQGPAGFNSITVVRGPTVFLSPFGEPGAVGLSVARCPANARAISGGWENLGILATVGLNAGGPGSWAVIAINNDEFEGTQFNTVVTCVS